MNTPIRVVSLEATPDASTAAAEEASGAYVNIYVSASTDAIAIDRAKREIQEAGWAVSTPAEVSLVTADSFEPGSSGLKYYEQCLIDGIVIRGGSGCLNTELASISGALRV